MPNSKQCDVMFCILCEYRRKAIKVSAAAKIAAKTSKKNQDSAPKKKTKLTTASVAVIRELRHVAAFYSQVHIFTKVEKAN